ncbi:MAG TPA: GIY-YIG nuclease family protein [Patescibacteria group bacterium]|nr:GIY-YIG nuclease family protein [Patescibacteria group bacterium]
MKRAHILSEIARTASANGGVPLGEARFESETGIKRPDWYGKHWAKWGDAVQEAGFTPNKLNPAFRDELLLGKYSEYARELGRLPTAGDLRLKRQNDPEFPSWNTFARFGSKAEMVKKALEFCRSDQGFQNVVEQCENYLRALTSAPDEDEPSAEKVVIGYVYIIKHGSRREYKIGRTNNRLRREGEIGLELPEKIEPIHVIETDDPAGVEAYWHRRFAEKRMKNEWFAPTSDDVRAFKRWRRIS